MNDQAASTGPRGLFVGLATLDVLSYVEHAPGPDEKVTAEAQLAVAGGPAANAAVTFAGLGGSARLVTALGAHPIADVIRAELATRGVAVTDVLSGRPGDPSVSSISVTLASGDRAVVGRDARDLVVDPAPDLTVEAEDVAVVVVDGHLSAIMYAAITAAATGGRPLVVDAGRWRSTMPALLRPTHHLICSQAFRVPGSTDERSSALALRTQGVDSVAVTRGAQGVLWWEGVESGEVRPPAVTAIDTLGAGDAFHGAYAYALACGVVTMPERLRFAAAVAAHACTARGTRTWLDDMPADIAGWPMPHLHGSSR